ncbi:MAG: tripartite tricarboxylate transporter permease [archaeon]
MLFEALLSVLAGICVGTFTGLVPGIHVNTVVAALLGARLRYDPLLLSVFIFSVAITHTFLDFVPSVLLGVPSEDTALAILPAHRMVLAGRAAEAIKLTLIGSIACLALGAALMPLYLKAIPAVYGAIEPHLGYILVSCSVILILSEGGDKRLWAAAVFLCSGALGMASMRMLQIREPLLPLLTGLFGFSLILLNLRNKVQIPVQVDARVDIAKASLARGIFGGTLAGSIVGFLPGFGPSQAAVMAGALVGNKSDREFLVTLGGINTANMLFTLVAFLTIGKTRSGAVAGISRLIGIDMQSTLLLIGAALLAGGISLAVGMKMAVVFPKAIRRIDYTKLNAAVATGVFLIVAALSGLFGIAVLLTATALGLAAHFAGVRKMHLMGALIVPAALWFLGPASF